MKTLLTNIDIRNKITEYGLFYYEVAEELAMKNSNFSVLLKTFLTEPQKKKIYEAIEKAYRKKKRRNKNDRLTKK